MDVGKQYPAPFEFITDIEKYQGRGLPSFKVMIR
jgi:hypothetical protein